MSLFSSLGPRSRSHLLPKAECERKKSKESIMIKSYLVSVTSNTQFLA